MNRYFTRTFFRLLFGFITILALAFGALYAGAQFMTPPADNSSLLAR